MPTSFLIAMNVKSEHGTSGCFALFVYWVAWLVLFCLCVCLSVCKSAFSFVFLQINPYGYSWNDLCPVLSVEWQWFLALKIGLVPLRARAPPAGWGVGLDCGWIEVSTRMNLPRAFFPSHAHARSRSSSFSFVFLQKNKKLFDWRTPHDKL